MILFVGVARIEVREARHNDEHRDITMPFKELVRKGYPPKQAKAIMAKEGAKKKKPRGFAALG